jgi:signal transduction histidine kinase
VTLRPLGREPVFGPLWRDLRRAEAWAEQPTRTRALVAVDGRLRGVHSERLGALLRLGPRTRLDGAALADWIRDLEAELAADGWTPPAILLQDLELDFPVERAALCTIFANLLRNAETAVRAQAPGHVIVRVESARDATGRRVLTLLVGDSAPEPIALDAIEARESGRGLAIVRDLVREWRGHLVVRSETAPWTKAVGACFPV